MYGVGKSSTRPGMRSSQKLPFTLPQRLLVRAEFFVDHLIVALWVAVLCATSVKVTASVQSDSEDVDANRSNSSWRDPLGVLGDVLIGSLFPIFEENSDTGECDTFRELYVLSLVQPFLFLMRKRNFVLTATVTNSTRHAGPGQATVGAGGVADCLENCTQEFHVDLGFTVSDMCVGEKTPIDFSLVMSDFSPSQAVCSVQRGEGPFKFAREEIRSRPRPVVAMIGPTNSRQALVTAPILSAFNVVQVSPDATSDAFACHLSPGTEIDHCKSDFEYFFRTVSTDDTQAFAVADLLHHYQWNYTVVVHTSRFLGLSNQFSLRAREHDICIGFSRSYAADDEFSALSVVRELNSSRQVKVVVLFASDKDALAFFNAMAQFCQEEGRLGNGCVPRVFVGNDGWGYVARNTIRKERYYKASVDTTITFRPEVPPHFQEVVQSLQEEFYQQMKLETADMLREQPRDPWLCKELELANNCTGVCEPDVVDPVQMCNGSESFPEDLPHDLKLRTIAHPPVLLAVETVLVALENLFQEMVDQHPGKPEEFFRERFASFVHGERLLQAVKNVQLPCSGAGTNASLCPLFPDDWHEVQPAYSIQATSRTNSIATVGHWKLESAHSSNASAGQISINSLLIRWPRRTKQGAVQMGPPVSDCDVICSRGVGKYKILGSCCFTCDPCPQNFISNGNERCTRCPHGEGSSNHSDRCVPLPERGLGKTSRLVLGAICVYLVMTVLVTIFIYCYKRRSPIIRSDFQLTMALLVSLLFTVAAGFLDTATHTLSICIASRMLSTPAILVSVAVIFVKTSRVARIGFRAHRMRALRMSWSLRTSAQLLFISALTLIGTLVELTQILANPPHPEKHIFTSEVIELCPVRSAVALTLDAYIVSIIVAISVLAFMIRKLPMNIREAWHLFLCGFSLTASWVPLRIVFYLSTHENQVVLECIHFATHAFIIWLWLFVPRLNILILHPERNVRSMPKSMRLTWTSSTLRIPSGVFATSNSSTSARMSQTHFSQPHPNFSHLTEDSQSPNLKYDMNY